MRTRKEIENQRDQMRGIDDIRLFLEILLDIRDLLDNKNIPKRGKIN